ncbi:MAG: hypothetical protein GC164_14695 [Phycisphaera sp.]|nr:hypothetical protein [Phycisphaera sp.]
MWQATRPLDAPIITPQTPGYDVASLGTNINGPSLIRVPGFVRNPLGRYYLYFASHNGKHIRLAFADELIGPWRIHDQPPLHIGQTTFNRHIASPDVIVDESLGRLRMYYHGCCPKSPTGEWEQPTRVALSTDGLTWESQHGDLGESYFRAFEIDGTTYAIAKGGVLYRSQDGLHNFERFDCLDRSGRHWAVLVNQDSIDWFYSRWGDCPERILCARTPADPRKWTITQRYDLLRPEHEWEGSNQPLHISLNGAVAGPVNQLRDPAIFVDDDGQTYLLYTTAGESGIAIARLHQSPA